MVTESYGENQPAQTPMAERMQALLSRAVEDQISEQRQLTSALAELRGLVGRLSDEASKPGTAPDPRLDQVLSDVSGVERSLRTGLQALGEGLAGLTAAVQARPAEAAEVVSRIDEVRENLRGHAVVLQALRAGLDALPSFPDEIAALRQQVEGLGSRLDAFGELNETLSTTAGRLTALDDLVAEVGASRAATERVAGRAEWLAGRDDVDELRRALLERLEQVRAEQAAHVAGRFEGLARADAVADLADRLDELVRRPAGVDQERLTAIESRLDALSSRVEQLLEWLEDDPRMERVERSMESTRIAAEEAVSASGRLHSELTVIGESVSGVDTADELKALREELADLRAAVTAPADTSESEALRALVAETERRLAAHVDEAVLALAEVMLRRRPVVRPVAEPAPAPEPPAPEPVVTRAAAPQPAPEQEQEPAAAEVPYAAPEPEPRKRRPWWKPGD